ncbi:helix-turn-helix domain-containing protein [Pedobacter cryotolerans]|uniref:Helix-turn-helix domain-containing protein n=1 Tax=Pedobacter cryotolerans TaxID=2571270 RepID=A0A4U1CB27_9SPHI|nr:helix-turn-helix domain-containing protein [Pedobacter cryotolerans]TKC03118.1 helix-turn-helix domain-containing protein [Pedobacter cryotolerans]
MNVELITRDDLKQFKSELILKLKQIFKPETALNKQWLRSAEVRKLLKISAGTLQNLRINGTLPFRKIGSIMYYAYNDIVRVMEEGGGK